MQTRASPWRQRDELAASSSMRAFGKQRIMPVAGADLGSSAPACGQAMMLTRVPCPGGSGAWAGGEAFLESSLLGSGGGLVWTGCRGAGNGGGALMLEMLIGNILSGNVRSGLCAQKENEW